jgi:hypothetical protein
MPPVSGPLTSRAWQKPHDDRQRCVLRGGFFECHVSPVRTGTARKVGPVRAARINVWQVLSQRPSRLAQGWRYPKTLARYPHCVKPSAITCCQFVPAPARFNPIFWPYNVVRLQDLVPSSPIKNSLQLLGAGLFVFFGLVLTVLLFSWLFQRTQPLWLIAPLMLVAFFALILAAMVLFRGKSPRQISVERYAQRIRKLEEEGLLLPQPFRACRAFAVDEFEDEGIHFYLELEDGSTLFLSGQYLYDYEPARAGRHGAAAQVRRFPCTEFTVRRHKVNGYAVDILCSGSALEPEIVAPWFDEDDFKNGRVPEDGAILREKTYDEIKMERQKRQ